VIYQEKFFAGARMKTAREVWPSRRWVEYFRRNRASLMVIPWELGIELSPEERRAVESSVPEFQLGESSDGLRFIEMAELYALQSGDVEYVRALKLFIREEQRHGRELGKVLDLAGIPRIKHSWSDAIFRWMRHRCGLGLSIAVLVTAEIIAKIYYIAVREATASVALRRLCDQILQDEVEHIRFQCERLAILRSSWPCVLVKLNHAWHWFFMAGTFVVVWRKHRLLLRQGGYGFFSFGKAVFGELRDAVRIMNPASYHWPAALENAPLVNTAQKHEDARGQIVRS
ncbi:MAG TPA: ferritin-like domain-containing protein, partial [Tepidisphaeraceae bacterium]|nr:ferritin-like domain-containing protein [Tepidisphaeraceae bacterium]